MTNARQIAIETGQDLGKVIAFLSAVEQGDIQDAEDAANDLGLPFEHGDDDENDQGIDE